MRKLWIRRKAVSPMISGVIVLGLFLTAIISMVFVSQQFDQYQSQANRMSQFSNQRLSEDLDFNSPGLTLLTSATVPGWGSGCGTNGVGTYSCYSLSMSNKGSVGVQIVRIYINSTGPTGSGCSLPNPQPCILNPTLTIASYAFNQANQFINPGETNHTITLALPITVTLPNPAPPTPENSIEMITSRGNAFSLQWPFQLSLLGQSQSAYSQGNMRIAYIGTFDSAKEPGHGGSGGTGYCHNEAAATYPAPAGYAEELTGITGYGDLGVLWFENPWITASNKTSANAMVYGSGQTANLATGTTFYLYVIIINTGTTNYSPTAGTVDIAWYGSNHIDGTFIGVYYNNIFYPPSSPPSNGIPPGAFYYALYTQQYFTVGNTPWYVQPTSPTVMWWGGASITNGLNSNNEGPSYWAGTVLVSGLWMRYEASPCA